MPRRRYVYLRMILKNILLFMVVFLIISSLITLGQLRLKRMELEDTYVSMLKIIGTTPSLQGMNESEYAWYLTYKLLNVKPTFWESFKYYLMGAIKISQLKDTTGPWGVRFYLQNTFFILLISESLILPAGLYLGLRAGYNRGFTEKLVSTLAPFFSAMPPWFIGAILFLLLWASGQTPDFWMKIQEASTNGSLNVLTYLEGYLPPALTLFFAGV